MCYAKCGFKNLARDQLWHWLEERHPLDINRTCLSEGSSNNRGLYGVFSPLQEQLVADRELQIGFGILCIVNSDFARAADYFSAVLEPPRNPGDLIFRYDDIFQYEYARCLKEAGRKREAIRAYCMVLKRLPQCTNAAFDLGGLLMRMEKPLEAAKTLSWWLGRRDYDGSDCVVVKGEHDIMWMLAGAFNALVNALVSPAVREGDIHSFYL
jgi:tetratricopeptide (TPR) repeat protein